MKLPKMSKNVKIFKYNGGDETKNNKLIHLRVDDNNSLETSKTFRLWLKTEKTSN